MTESARRWLMGLIALLFLLLLVIAVLLWLLFARPIAPAPTAEPPTASTTIAESAATPTLLVTVPATPTPLAPATPNPTSCPQPPAPRWADTIYAEFEQQLGCPTTGEISTAATESPANGAFQYFEGGTMIWRQHNDAIYVLYDDGGYVVFPDDSPANYYESELLKGGFGYLWNTNEDVRGLIGNPLTIEYGANDFALQDFAGGTILYFFDQVGQTYVLLAESSQWTVRPQA